MSRMCRMFLDIFENCLVSSMCAVDEDESIELIVKASAIMFEQLAVIGAIHHTAPRPRASFTPSLPQLIPTMDGRTLRVRDQTVARPPKV